MSASKIRVKILRRADNDAESHWEQFEVPFRENINVISCLQEIQRNPVTTEGKEVQPPAWEAACLEEVCGSCTMNINGAVRQACTALIEEVCELDGDVYEITLEPMKKFPTVRDLIVDRQQMFENLKKIRGGGCRSTAATISAWPSRRTTTSANCATRSLVA